MQYGNRLNVIFCSIVRDERLRRRRELYRLRRSTEAMEQRELRLATRREQERRQRATMTANACTQARPTMLLASV